MVEKEEFTVKDAVRIKRNLRRTAKKRRGRKIKYKCAIEDIMNIECKNLSEKICNPPKCKYVKTQKRKYCRKSKNTRKTKNMNNK